MSHIEDVRSDMSAFHRVDSIEDELTTATFVSRMVRLPHYDGAVAGSLRAAIAAPEPAAVRRAPDAAFGASSPSAHDLQHMSQGGLYGPLPGAGQDVGLFDVTIL